MATCLHRRNFGVIVLALGLMGTAAVGLRNLRTSVRIETLFAPDSRIMEDYRWLEENLGPLVPIEVLVTFPTECSLSDRGRLDLVWRINRTLRKQNHVYSTTSALTFFPPLPPLKSFPANIQSAIVNKAIGLAKPGFEQTGMVRRIADGEVWRLTAHVSAIEPLDYGFILGDVREAIDIELKQANEGKLNRVTATTSGIMPLVHQIQAQLLNDLFNSLISALVIITITMTIVEAGLLNGLVAMVSNIFPIIIAFGWMGWRNIPMDIGSVMTASVALGIAVDDTLHFLTYFRRALNLPQATRYSAVLRHIPSLRTGDDPDLRLLRTWSAGLFTQRLCPHQPFRDPDHHSAAAGTAGRPHPAARTAAFACRETVSATGLQGATFD